MAKPLRIFISYSRADSAERSLIADALRKLPDCEALYDRNQLRAGLEVYPTILELIESADCVVALLTPEGSRSVAVREELVRAHQWGKYFVPVVRDDVQPRDVPWFIQGLHQLRYPQNEFDPVPAAVVDHVLLKWRPKDVANEGTRDTAGVLGVYPGMDEMFPDIREAIGVMNREKIGRSLDVIGGRFRSINLLIKRLANDDLLDGLQPRFTYLAPQFLEQSPPPWPRAPLESRYLRDSIAALDSIMQSRGGCRFRSYSAIPSSWAWIVGDVAVFWGHFHWSARDQTYLGPTKPCFRLLRDQAGYGDMREWAAGLYGQWHVDNGDVRGASA